MENAEAKPGGPIIPDSKKYFMENAHAVPTKPRKRSVSVLLQFAPRMSQEPRNIILDIYQDGISARRAGRPSQGYQA